MSNRLSFQKTRIAPTPSGYLHLGNALSFSLTAALADAYGAAIVLRIDDLDQQRVNIDYIEDIFATLKLLGIHWDEGPLDEGGFQQQYSQLQRLPLYEELLRQLAAHKRVYACTCSRSEILKRNAAGYYDGYCRDRQLPLDTPNACWRLYTTQEETIVVNELLVGSKQERLPADMYDFVVRKKDGLPAYQVTSLADDCHYGIDLIVRGKDLWPSTIAQLYLAQLLDKRAFLQVTFLHHPLLLNKDGEKMSKSAGATAIKTLRERGVTTAELFKSMASEFGTAGAPADYLSLVKMIMPALAVISPLHQRSSPGETSAKSG